jgi:hypothetical protein
MVQDIKIHKVEVVAGSEPLVAVMEARSMETEMVEGMEERTSNTTTNLGTAKKRKSRKAGTPRKRKEKRSSSSSSSTEVKKRTNREMFR